MHALTQPDHMALAHLSECGKLPVMSRWAVRVAFLTLVWTQRRRTRAQLKQLDASLLHDIGLTPDQAATEYLKWFWRA